MIPRHNGGNYDFTNLVLLQFSLVLRMMIAVGVQWSNLANLVRLDDDDDDDDVEDDDNDDCDDDLAVCSDPI